MGAKQPAEAEEVRFKVGDLVECYCGCGDMIFVTEVSNDIFSGLYTAGRTEARTHSQVTWKLVRLPDGLETLEEKLTWLAMGK